MSSNHHPNHQPQQQQRVPPPPQQQQEQRRKRNRNRNTATTTTTSVTSASSVSSVSSGDHTDRSSYKSRRSKSSVHSQQQQQQQQHSKSHFSGFWSDGEMIDDDDDDANHNNHNTENKNHNKENKNQKISRSSKSQNSSSSNNNNSKGITEYEGFYLTIGDTIYQIGIGDVVAMRNSMETEEYGNHSGNHNHGSNNNNGIKNANSTDAGSNDDVDDNDEENTREQRRKRRLERTANAKEAPAPPPAAAIASSDYVADAQSEHPSNYYQAVNPETTTQAENVHETGNGAPSALAPNTETAAATTELPSKPPPVAAVAAPALAAPPRKEFKTGDGLMLARVERIWQEHKHAPKGIHANNKKQQQPQQHGGGKVLFKARWFLKKDDVDCLPLGELTGPVDSEVFAKTITEHDLVLSNQSDDNHVTTICDVLQVLYRDPELDAVMPSHVLPATYLCRYALRIMDNSRVVILPYTGDNDDWKEMTVSAISSKKKSIDNGTSVGSTTVGNEEQGHFLQHNLFTPTQGSAKLRSGNHQTPVVTSAQKRRRVGDFAEESIDEGTMEQRDIQIGSDHQVPVPLFDPNRAVDVGSRGRNPTHLWKPDKISQEGTDEYIEQAARILTPYLRQRRLTQEEPYAPFPTKRMEELSRMLKQKRLPTLSSVSSVSSMTTNRVDALREFDLDALLRNLHVSNYNVRAAIAAIEASPKDYLVAWSPHEKARFNTGFRRYSGSLRAIYKGMGNKALQEVIDYHYRFKIPDQFRKVQERKREQAIRMLECIETRRNLNAPIMVSTGDTTTVGPLANGGSKPAALKDKGDWTKTSTASLTVSLDERRAKAKELLLDVEAKLGRNKMLKVFDVFEHADETTLVECKTKLLEIFKGHREFQSRFLEFLPQQLRL